MRICLRRREFIAGLGGAAVAWPLSVRAQQGERVRRIGVLMPDDENDPVAKTRLTAFTQALTGLGWTEGRNAGFFILIQRPPGYKPIGPVSVFATGCTTAYVAARAW